VTECLQQKVAKAAVGPMSPDIITIII